MTIEWVVHIVMLIQQPDVSLIEKQITQHRAGTTDRSACEQQLSAEAMRLIKSHKTDSIGLTLTCKPKGFREHVEANLERTAA